MGVIFSDSFTRANTSVSAGSTWGNGWTTPVYNNAGCAISANMGLVGHVVLSDAYAYGCAPVGTLADATASFITTSLLYNNAHEVLLRSTHTGRLRTQHSGYSFGGYANGTTVYYTLYRIVNGSFTALAYTTKTTQSPVTVTFSASGSTLVGTTSNGVSLTVSDSMHTSGWVGIRAYKNVTNSMLFDDFSVAVPDTASGKPPIYHLVQGGCL